MTYVFKNYSKSAEQKQFAARKNTHDEHQREKNTHDEQQQKVH